MQIVLIILDLASGICEDKDEACSLGRQGDKNVFCSIPWSVSNCPTVCDPNCQIRTRLMVRKMIDDDYDECGPSNVCKPDDKKDIRVVFDTIETSKSWGIF